jgi:hypothetical protein
MKTGKEVRGSGKVSVTNRKSSWRKGMTKPSLPGHSDRIGGRENMVMIRDHLPYFRRKLPQVFREECRDEGI